MMADLSAKVRKVDRFFLVTVVVPTLLAILYFGFFASDVYVSESRFVVRSPDQPQQSGIGVLLKTAGFSNAGDEISAARSFVLSRDALGVLNRNQQFSNAYGSIGVSVFDRFNATGLFGSFEDLYSYFQTKVRIELDPATSITSLTVRAYTPDDAQKINAQLLEMAEATVNKLSSRGRDDLVKFAQAEADEAKERARRASLALAAYRNQAGVVDPEKQAAVQLQMISKLQDELIASKTQLRQLKALAPRNPQIGGLAIKVDELQRQIAEQMNQVAGGQRSLANTVAKYQGLALESQYSEKQLAAALASLQEARNEARRKQAYVERIVEPNRPDAPLEPRRFRGILATFILGLVVWGILSMLFAGVREHNE